MGNALTLNQLPQKTDRTGLRRKVFPGHLSETVPLTRPILNLPANAPPITKGDCALWPTCGQALVTLFRC